VLLCLEVCAACGEAAESFKNVAIPLLPRILANLAKTSQRPVPSHKPLRDMRLKAKIFYVHGEVFDVHGEDLTSILLASPSSQS
jgi:hypothetical protein